MAFSSAPEKDTYSSQRVPLVHDLDFIPGTASTQLSGMTNVLPFGDKREEAYGETRNGITGNIVAGYAGSPLTCRGMHVWEKTTGTVYYFVVSNQNVYSSTNGTSWTLVNTLTTNATSPVRFTEFIDGTNTKKLVLVDGVEGYVFTSNAAGTKITDADFPSPHVPFPVVIDGYLFLAKANTGDIYNSDLNDPSTWTAGNFISSELYPDDIQALIKVDNYLLAIGTQGCEYFYDAATSTGSPLARQEGGSLPFGTSFPNAIAASKNTVVVLANNNDGDAVFKVIEGLRYADMPGGVASRVLNLYLSASMPSNYLRGYFVRQNGDLFYGLNFYGEQSTNSAVTTYTLMYSVKHQLWTRTALGDTNEAWPVCHTAPSTSLNSLTYVAGHQRGSVFFGTFSYSDSGGADNLSDGNAYNSVQELQTPPVDFGTMNRKFLYRVGLSYVRRNDASLTAPNISYSDDVGGTWSTARTLSTTYAGEFPVITQLGNFRFRQFKVTGTGRTRWYFLECDINKGQQ